MSESVWELVIDGFGRLEAPAFDKNGRLCFSDMEEPGGVFRLEQDGLVTRLAERHHVGGVLAHIDGGLLVTGPHVVVLYDDGTERMVMEHRSGLGDGWGFNDMITDQEGNVFVGMHGEIPTGGPVTVTSSLWRLEPGGVVRHCYDDIQMTNGIALSPDGARLYHADTTPRTIWVSDIDEQGLPQNRRVHHVLRYGSPDGVAIDEEGCLWLAGVGAGKIVRVTPDGAEDLVLEAPQVFTSSVRFGGDDGRDLYCATFGGERYDPGRTGAIFRTRVDVAGAPITPARV
jgi:sugar lactone lactonase YvrE